MNTHASGSTRLNPQRGVVLIFAMIALVIMLIGAVAISRSVNSAQFNIGNLGFKRDLTNQSERAVRAALEAVRGTGLLANPVERFNDKPTANYSAVKLADNPQGIPTVLLQPDATFRASYTAPLLDVLDQNVEVRYVVDRLAVAAGACTTATCAMAVTPPSGTDAKGLYTAPPPPQPIYRLTVKLTGPRNTMSFFQSTFTAD